MGDGDVGDSVMVLVVTTQVGPTTAQATAPPPTLTKTVIVAGDSVGVNGSGCVAGTQVQVQLDSVTLVTATSTASGTYSALLVVPKAVTPGAHTVTVVCAAPNGTVTTTTATITVSPTATTGYSPRPPIVVASHPPDAGWRLSRRQEPPAAAARQGPFAVTGHLRHEVAATGRISGGS